MHTGVVGLGVGVGIGVPMGIQLGPSHVRVLTVVPSQGLQLGLGGGPKTLTLMSMDIGIGSGIVNTSVSLPSYIPVSELLQRKRVGVLGQSPLDGTGRRVISSPGNEKVVRSSGSRRIPIPVGGAHVGVGLVWAEASWRASASSVMIWRIAMSRRRLCIVLLFSI